MKWELPRILLTVLLDEILSTRGEVVPVPQLLYELDPSEPVRPLGIDWMVKFRGRVVRGSGDEVRYITLHHGRITCKGEIVGVQFQVLDKGDIWFRHEPQEDEGDLVWRFHWPSRTQLPPEPGE